MPDSGDDAREDDAVESSGPANAGHDSALLDLPEVQEVSADERASDIGDRRRITRRKYQRQHRRHRRRHQSGQQDSNALHRPGNGVASSDAALHHADIGPAMTAAICALAPRTQRLLEAPVLSSLLRRSAPNLAEAAARVCHFSVACEDGKWSHDRSQQLVIMQ
jgi:hypothetical protein